MTATPSPSRELSEYTLTELCDHIEQTHHRYLRAEMPKILGKLNKIAIKYGEKDPVSCSFAIPLPALCSA